MVMSKAYNGGSWMHRLVGGAYFFRIHMLNGLTSQRLLALFVVGLLVLNFPLLGLWDMDASVMGLPLFPTALMALWTLLIVALAFGFAASLLFHTVTMGIFSKKMNKEGAMAGMLAGFCT